MSETAQGIDQQQVLHNGNYRHFISSRICSSLGFQSLAVALGWMMYDLTQNAYMLGFVGLSQFAAMAVLTFVAGPVVDRFDRRRIGFLCQIIEGLTALCIGALILTGTFSAPMILIAVAVLGGCQAFERPTMASLLPNIVSRSMLQRAVATSSSFMQTALIVGPSLGGLLYGFGERAPFLFSMVAFVIAGWNVASIRLVSAGHPKTPISLGTVFAGLSFIRGRPAILGTISLDLFAVLFGGAVALLPIFASDILAAGPIGLGLLRAAPAVGALLMSIVLARRPITRSAGRKMFLAVAVFGLATVLFALSSNIALSILALLITGAADNVSVVIRSSLVQLLTPDEMRGRVNAVNSLFIGTSNQLGEFESGMAAGLAGPVAAGVIGGVGTLAVVLVWMRLFPELRRVERLDGR
ncbi:MFS transporter [Paenirhodobacter populi]|uniref:MFS transporter n=1 Tax=Paenirhodobacter populi TaxID=2306993 RepID=UPI0019D4B68D|nr:MFS transporter [Sinirhodobacter populi]